MTTLTTVACVLPFVNMVVSAKAQTVIGPQSVTGDEPPLDLIGPLTIQVPSALNGVSASNGGVANLNITANLGVINIIANPGAIDAAGLSVGGDGSHITDVNTNITLGDGTFSTAAVGIFDSNGHPNPNTIELDGVNITTGSGYKGLYMEDDNLQSQIVFKNGAITVGEGAIGVSAEFEGANIIINNSTVTVGDGGIGLQNFITTDFRTKIFTTNTNVNVGNGGIGAFFSGVAFFP